MSPPAEAKSPSAIKVQTPGPEPASSSAEVLTPAVALSVESPADSSPAAAGASVLGVDPGVADAEGVPPGVGVAEVAVLVVGLALGVPEGLLVGLTVGFGVGFTVGLGVGLGAGPTGFALGYFFPSPSWKRKATQPPSGIDNWVTPLSAYFQPPPLPSAQNRPQ